MNKSFRITDKTMHVVLLVGSCILALTILVLSIVVGINQRRENDSALTSDGAVTSSGATDGSSATDVKPARPTIDEMVFALPVEGALMQVHDLQTLAYSATMQDYRIHTGIDIETEAGAAVFACASGSVAEIYTDALMGNSIVIDHGNGVRSVYRNLDDTLPERMEVGMTVASGQLIGAVGESALVEVGEHPHLHFELVNNGVPVDPVDYLSYTPVSEVVED